MTKCLINVLESMVVDWSPSLALARALMRLVRKERMNKMRWKDLTFLSMEQIRGESCMILSLKERRL